MNQDEIIAMAKEASICHSADSYEFTHDGMLGFAALVAAKERGRFALECIDLVALHGGSVEIEAAIRARDQKEGT